MNANLRKIFLECEDMMTNWQVNEFGNVYQPACIPIFLETRLPYDDVVLFGRSVRMITCADDWDACVPKLCQNPMCFVHYATHSMNSNLRGKPNLARSRLRASTESWCSHLRIWFCATTSPVLRSTMLTLAMKPFTLSFLIIYTT